ncbi:MAG: CFI-box-CTERM domain-containing protein [Patescibacteria group bacterium]
MTRYSDSDAAQDTGVDSREVSDAWHQARNDHEGRGGGDDDLYDTSWRDSADSELQSWFGSGDLCYIATATLGTYAFAELDLLKSWRYSELESSRLGMWLSNYYRRTAPDVAKRLPNKPVLRASFRTIFVEPAIWFLKNVSEESLGRIARNLAMWALFLAGLAYGTLVSKFFSVEDSL